MQSLRSPPISWMLTRMHRSATTRLGSAPPRMFDLWRDWKFVDAQVRCLGSAVSQAG